MKNKSFKSKQMDLDPLSTTIVDDLIQSAGQWKGINDIVRLTLKALTDVVRVQGSSIKQINNTLPTRASKSQLSTGLSLKANLNDVSRTFSQVSNALDTRITLNELHQVIKDYMSKQEFQDALITKGYLNDGRNTSKIYTSSTQSDHKSQDINRQITKRMSGYVTLNEFQDLLTIIEQKPNINEVNQILQNKVSKPVFNAALQKLISRNQFQNSLSKKSDLTDLEYIVSTLQTKADLSTIEKLTQIIENKTDKSDSEMLFSKLEQIPQQGDIELILESIDQMRISIDKLGEDRQIPSKKMDYLENQISNLNTSLHSKISHTQSTAIMTNLKYQINQEVAKMKLHIRNYMNDDQSKSMELFSAKQLLKQVSLWKKQKQVICKQIDDIKQKSENQKNREQSQQVKQLQKQLSEFKKRYNQFKNDTILNLEQKLSTQQLEQVLARWVEQIHLKMSEDKDNTLKSVKQIEQLVSIKLADYSTQIQHISSISKKHLSEESLFDESLRRIRRQNQDLKNITDKLCIQVQNKLNQNQYESDLLEIGKKLELFNKELQQKSNIKDVCVLVDSKPNIQEINKALKEIHSQLSEKVSTEQLKTVVEDQASINETLCEENIIGRWIWHSGQAKAGNLIPWESQTVNTLPHNFLWDKDQTSILTLASGLYEITVNIFSKYKPSMQLMINGEVVCSKQNKHIHQEKQKQNLNNKKRKGKQIGSIKIHQFYMLPTRARISVSFSGEPGCEGFLNIKRL